MPYFEPAVATFFEQLGRHNSRDWFVAHRDEYERLVRKPLEDLAAEAGERYGTSRVMRPNRDVRFSTDKTPYKRNGSMWAGDVGGVYLEVDAAGISAGGGLYEPTRDQLRRGREAIDATPRAADALERALASLAEGGFEIAGPPLTTAPRGWARDHPHIELLRLTHYAAVRRLPLGAEHADIRDAWRSVDPLTAWVQRWVGPALSWP